MGAASKATEKAEKVTKKSIIGYSALGAAIGTVFTDFLRSSSVISTLMGTFSTLFGAAADVILVELIPVFMPLIEGLVNLIKWLQELPGPAKLVIGVIIGIGAALLILGGPLTAIILVIAAIILIWQNWGAIVDWFQTNVIEPFVNSPWGKTLIAVFQVVLPFLLILRNAFVASFGWIISNVIEPFVEFIRPLADFILGVFTDPIGTITGLYEEFGRTLGGIWDGIVRGVQAVGEWITGVFTGAWSGITSIWDTATTFFSNIFSGIFDAFKGPFNAFIAGIEGVINIFADSINATFGLIPGVPHLARLTLPRLQAGGEVITTGAAIVHKGETVLPAGGAITLNVTNIFEIGGGMPGLPAYAGEDAFRRQFQEAGEEVGESILTVLRRRRE